VQSMRLPLAYGSPSRTLAWPSAICGRTTRSSSTLKMQCVPSSSRAELRGTYPALTKRPASLRLPRRSTDTRRRSRRTHRACGPCHPDKSSRGTALLKTRPVSSSHPRSEVPQAEPERERVSASSEVHTVVAGARRASPSPHSVSPSASPRRRTYGSVRGPKILERSARYEHRHWQGGREQGDVA
jgi:hypothetical protein